MNEKKKVMLARVLDMNETELRAALITIVNGFTIEDAVDGAYNPFKHLTSPSRHDNKILLRDL